MLEALAEQRQHVPVVEGVENHSPVAARADDARVSQEAELVGNCRLGDPELIGEVADAALGPGERIEDADAGRITEDAEDFGQAVDGMGIELRHMNKCSYINTNLAGLAAVRIPSRVGDPNTCALYRLHAMIEVQNLTKRYGPFTAVDDVSFRAERGEILGFLGPNGAGKTTTMRVLTGYMPPTDGRAVIAGYDVIEQPIEAKRRTGYLPETPPLYPDMTVRDYLTFCARIKGVPRADRKARVNTVMERTRVADMANRHCAKLSKGYKQRVGLAQSLINDPELLFLDEPTTGLDPIGARQMKDTILAVRDQGKTVLLCSHLLADVQAICDRVVILSEGKLVKFGTVPELVGPSQKFEIFADGVNDEALASAAQKKYVVAKDNGKARFEANSSEELDEILTFIRNANGRTVDVKGHSETLEDVFVRSVKSDGR